MTEITPKNVDGISKIWAIQVSSPALSSLRKSYGLPPLINNDHAFHITVAVRRKKVLQNNDVSKFDGAQGRGELKAASADTVTYDCNCAGACMCPETCTCEQHGRCGGAHKKAATSSRSGTKVSRAGQKDLLQGGKADNIPDREFSPSSLSEGASHEHEHTNKNQVAKEIAKDHLSEDPDYYKKVKSIEKAAGKPRIIDELLLAKRHSDNKRYGHKTQILRKLMEQSPQDWMIDDSAPQFPGITHTPTKFQFHTDRTAIAKGVKAASVYGTAAQNVLFNPRNPLAYDSTKPVFNNIQKQLAEIKSRGDFMMRAQRNNQIYKATIDPNYRHQLALQAFQGTMPQPALSDQMIETYGDGMLGAMAHAGRR